MYLTWVKTHLLFGWIFPPIRVSCEPSVAWGCIGASPACSAVSAAPGPGNWHHRRNTRDAQTHWAPRLAEPCLLLHTISCLSLQVFRPSMNVLFFKKCDTQANSFQISPDIFVALEFMSVNQLCGRRSLTLCHSEYSHCMFNGYVGLYLHYV